MNKKILKMPSELENAKEQIIRLQLENHNLRQTMIDEFNRFHHWQIENEKLQKENEQIKKDYAKLHIDFAKCNEENDNLKDDIDKQQLYMDSLEQENEQLKADIESRTMCITCERELQNCNLQAENENLKARKDKYYKITLDYEIQISDLVQENEKLKEENKELKSNLVSQASTIFTLEKSSNDLSQGINKLYQAMQEIQKIADTEIDKMVKDDTFINVFGAIRNKIDEVIGEGE